ncbi:hypothetical protein HNY73_015182 [Argiope bruennichi]|uniref:Uncharacterized protein n=1 Tax=Argiope bruennichi TaxID=94029 RepID=A0A8T0EST7_ARGBR|nr:hypothetical protein HNY73_015182 [Argiope bruennichi]
MTFLKVLRDCEEEADMMSSQINRREEAAVLVRKHDEFQITEEAAVHPDYVTLGDRAPTLTGLKSQVTGFVLKIVLVSIHKSEGNPQ